MTAPREYNRDPEGTSTGGQFTVSTHSAPASSSKEKKAKAEPEKAGVASSSRFKTLAPGEKNDKATVKEMQQLLSALGLGKLAVDGDYGPATTEAVKAAQRKLGLRPTGKASKALVNKLLAAYDLSPCIKRSDDECDEIFTVTRSEADVFDTLRADVDEVTDEDLGEEVSDASRSAPTGNGLEILRYDRLWTLDDIVVRSGGDGRTVEAYAAVFDTPTEITDQHGHYMEVISRSAFNRAISHGIDRIGFFYHHGMTLHGTPSDLGAVPLGSPVDVRADGKGLRTVSRFNKSQLADSVLEAIRSGDIRGYSFRGRIFQSTPDRVPRAPKGAIPTVTRTELGLTEYGPTPTPYYADAGILAVRSAQQVADVLARLDEQARSELMQIIRTTSAPTPQDPETDANATPAMGPGAEDPPVVALRSAADIRRRIRVAEILRGM